MTISLVGHFLVNQPISGKRVRTGWIEGNRSKGKAKCVDATRFDCIAKRKWGNTKLDFLPMKLCKDHLNTCAGEGAYTHLKICGHVFSSISLYPINSQLTHTWVSSPWKGKLCNFMLSKTFTGSVLPSRIQQGIMCAGLWNFHGEVGGCGMLTQGPVAFVFLILTWDLLCSSIGDRQCTLPVVYTEQTNSHLRYKAFRVWMLKVWKLTVLGFS